MNSTTSRQAALMCLVMILVVPLHSADAAQATRPDNQVTDWTPPTGTTPGWVRVPGTGPVTPGPGVPVTPATCAAETKTWTVGSFSCEGSLAEAAAPATLIATDTTDPNHGESSYTCSRRHGWQQRPGATCGPTECSAGTVRWQVGLNPKWCTGAAAKTDIGKTLVVNGTRETPVAGSATGTFLCGSDGKWAYQGGATDSCPQDCDPPPSGTTETWDTYLFNETWTCQATAPSLPDSRTTPNEWIVGDSASLTDTQHRQQGDAQDGIGSASLACVNEPSSAKGKLATSNAQCRPADCPNPPSTTGIRWSVIKDVWFGVHKREYKLGCQSSTTEIGHGGNQTLRDFGAPPSHPYATRGTSTAACDNGALALSNQACGCSAGRQSDCQPSCNATGYPTCTPNWP